MNTITILAKHTFKELIRKKDFYVFLFLLTGLMLFFYNESFFGSDNVTRYLKDIGFTLVIMFALIIAVTFSAKQIPSEIESKTVYPLLAKPVSRSQLVLGKYTGSLLISYSAFTIFYLLFLGIIFLKGEAASGWLLFQSYFFTLLLLALLSAITILLSMFLTLSANITLTLLLYCFIYWYNGTIRDLLLHPKGQATYLYNIAYHLLPHFEFYDLKIRIVHSWEALPPWVVLAVVFYTFIYVSAILAISCLLFKKKNL